MTRTALGDLEHPECELQGEYPGPLSSSRQQQSLVRATHLPEARAIASMIFSLRTVSPRMLP